MCIVNCEILAKGYGFKIRIIRSDGGSLQQPRRGEGASKIHGGATTLVGWSEAAYGGQSSCGKCRLGYVTGLMSSILSRPRRIIQGASKFTRKLMKSSLGGEVYAFSEMLGHMSVLRKFYGHF